MVKCGIVSLDDWNIATGKTQCKMALLKEDLWGIVSGGVTCLTSNENYDDI